jgi:cell cycle sensor histidine kinase DivJ
VSDTGIGIEAGDLARLGEPFTQVQNDYTRQFEGTGLGLSLVKGLVALHRGTMTIESAPGEGTTVAISLPVEGPGTAREDSAAAEAEINEAGNGTIRKIA